ncbi:MAG: ribbon-helix-helix domain-containing protein [Candidatus Dormibacteraeota bacterium]|nr:ribbon-helix-helix domain-containing protein [Candidatus Dormibacteraeota bacterium]
MKRTQIYLDQGQVAWLRSAARASQRTVSEIVREAIDEKLAHPDEPEFDAALRNAAGIWSDRDDLGSTAEYVRRIRQDRRGRPAR